MEPITDENIHRLVKEYLTNAISGLPNISGWDVSNVTNMQDLFKGYEYFDENLGSWDVSNVEDMSAMFRKCTNYTGDGLDAWGKKVGKVIDMRGMFNECENLIVNLGSWDVSNVEDMYAMFRKCTNYTGDGLDAWGKKVGKAINMSHMFRECENLIVNISGWVVNPNLVSTDIFKGCTSMPIEYRFVVPVIRPVLSPVINPVLNPVLSDEDDNDEDEDEEDEDDDDDDEEDDDDYEEAGETIAPKDKCFGLLVLTTLKVKIG